MLESITIKGFKSIRDLKLDLKPINVLIGANGSGKSNFIAVFELLNCIIDEKLQAYVKQNGGANSLLYFGRKNTDKISLAVKFGLNEYSLDLLPTADDSFAINDEICDFYGSGYAQPYNEAIVESNRESKISAHKGKKVVKFVYDVLKNWIVYHFHDTSPGSRVKQSGFIGDNQRLHEDASNLAAFLYRLKGSDPNYYDNIIKEIQLVHSFFQGFCFDTRSP